jgi:hypothetical protein
MTKVYNAAIVIHPATVCNIGIHCGDRVGYVDGECRSLSIVDVQPNTALSPAPSRLARKT